MKPLAARAIESGSAWRFRAAWIALFSVVLFGGALACANAQVVGAAARVNGVEIALFRLERHFEDFLKARARNVTTIRNPEVYKRLKREALDQLIDQELLWQEAQRRAITVDAGQVEKARASIAAGFASEQAFERRIREAGFDAASYADYLGRQISIGLVLDELVGDVSVADEDVDAFMTQNAARFAGLPQPDARRTAEQVLLRMRSDEAARNVVARLRERAVIEVLLRL